MTDQTTEYPHHVGGKVTDAIRQQMNAANERFGVKDGTLVRMALAAYLPTYLAAAGRAENVEVASRVCTALDQNPALRPELDALLRRSTRARRAAAEKAA